MNFRGLTPEQRVQFERLQVVSGLHGFEPGPIAEIAVLGEPLRLGLGRKSWYDLAEWLGARAVECTMEGPYYPVLLTQKTDYPRTGRWRSYSRRWHSSGSITLRMSSATASTLRSFTAGAGNVQTVPPPRAEPLY